MIRSTQVKRFHFRMLFFLVLLLVTNCENNSVSSEEPSDPATAVVAYIDRFSDASGTHYQRSKNSSLPEPNEPIDFDLAPFLIRGLSPDGEPVLFYDFDVMSAAPTPIYLLYREGEANPVEDQLNIIDALPGDPGYNDLWRVHKVTVPSDYKANAATSLSDLIEWGFIIEPTEMIVNCPVVPAGSTADLRYNPNEKTETEQGWYRGQVAHYFTFNEQPVRITNTNLIPISRLYVTFNKNAGEINGGMESGFMTEPNSNQTHNVLETIPSDQDYSPLWLIHIYDNSDFEAVSDLNSAENATILEEDAALVNCPVVKIL